MCIAIRRVLASLGIKRRPLSAGDLYRMLVRDMNHAVVSMLLDVRSGFAPLAFEDG